MPTLREAVLDSDIPAFGIASVTKATADCNEHRGIGFRRPVAQIPNHWYRALLRACGKWPRRRAADYG
jgi:hypothetical protein